MDGFPGMVVAPAGMGRFTFFFSTLPETTPGAGLPAAAACSALGTPRMASALGTPLMVAPSEGADVEGEPWPAAAARSRSSFALRSAMGTFGRAPAAAPAPAPPPGRAPPAKGCGAPAVGPEGSARAGAAGAAGAVAPDPPSPSEGGFFGPSLKVSLSPPMAPQRGSRQTGRASLPAPSRNREQRV